jgi:hypothetical protein
MALYENDLVTVVDELRLKGYTENFILKDNLIFSASLNQGFGENEIIIDGSYQFEISEETFDTQNLFAVFIPRLELKGLIIDLLGVYSYMEDQPISRILRDAPRVTYIFNDEAPNLKYGLKKITPADFDTQTNRYVLRVGFPDFPECPVGMAFSMLGFDKQALKYVWLSTKILKDSRLKRVSYKTGNETI